MFNYTFTNTANGSKPPHISIPSLYGDILVLINDCLILAILEKNKGHVTSELRLF